MGKKRRGSYLFNFIGIILVISVVFISMSAATLKAQTITLRYADFMPPRGPEVESLKWLMDEITKRTKGQVQFQQYFGGSLLGPRELLKGIQAGTADMAHIPVPYHPKELQPWTVTQSFIHGPSLENRPALYWEMYEQCPELAANLKSWNQKLVAIVHFADTSIGGTREVKGLADLKGLRVRCSGGYDAKHITDVGGKVVFIPGSETYSAMQKGAIDVNFAPVTTYYKYRLFETAKNNFIIKLPMFNGTFGLLTMNLNKWNSLPADVQQTITSVRKEFEKFIVAKITELLDENINDLKARGVVITEMSGEDVSRWADLTEESSKIQWISEAEKAGIPGKTLMDRITSLMKKHSN